MLGSMILEKLAVRTCVANIKEHKTTYISNNRKVGKKNEFVIYWYYIHKNSK